jgi:hypothetical protein
MAMDLSEIAEGCVREAKGDYVGLWQIADRVDRVDHDGLSSKQKALIVVRSILERGLWPGDYTKAGFAFWPEDSIDVWVTRIASEWDFLVRGPSLEYPICWFSLKPNNQLR